MDGLEVVCKLYNVSVVKFFKVSRDNCTGPLRVYAYKGSRESRKKRDACGAE